MQTSCIWAVMPDTNVPVIPGEMVRGGSSVLKSLIDLMMLYGVDKLEVGQQYYGQLLAISPRFHPMDKVEVPRWVTDCRKQAMYHLGNLFLLMGIFSLELTPTPEELAQVKTRWKACENLTGKEPHGNEPEPGPENPPGGPAEGSPAGSPPGNGP
jgi:hypothetical protein